MWGISGVACEGMSRGSRGGGQDSILTNSCIELVLNFSFVGIVGAGRGAARIVLWDLLRGGGVADHFLFILWIALFGPFRMAIRGVGVGLCGVQSWELGAGCEPHLPRLILLVSFSDTLLAVSILDIVYDCRLRPLLQFRRD